MLRTLVLSLLLTALALPAASVASTASALPVASDPARIPPPEPSFVHPPKSHVTAYLWALGATAMPIAAGIMIPDGNATTALILTGVMLGPSAGQFYAASHRTAWIGIGIRVAAIPVGILTGMVFASNSSGEGFDDLASFLGGAMLGGGLVLIAGTAYSLWDTRFAVDRANAKVASRMSLTPMLLPVGDAQRRTYAPGLAFSASF
jgi:hypothetical protein